MDKLPHDYKWKITKEPTCTREGQRVRTCKVCGHKQTQTIEKEPHEYGKWTVTKEPTCTAKGSRYRKCKVCGYKQEQTMDKLPHDYKWKIIVKATDHSSGTRKQVCKVCGHEEPEVSYDPKGTLRRGSRGDDVRQVQQLLADQGYLTARDVDGIFGGGMERAVMEFQKDQGLSPDGVAWPQTIQRLNHDFGPWTLAVPLTRSANGVRVRVCKDCGYEQKETLSAGVIENRSRGENVRAIQRMLGSMGYNPGAFDGIYGAKLDQAYAAFAADHGVDFQPGALWPVHVDALVNGWMAEKDPNSFVGAGNMNTSVDLALTVTPVGAADENGMVTYSWKLSNLGGQSCSFRALLLAYGDAPDFRRDTLTVAIDTIQLKANNGSSASGTFTVAPDWGVGKLNFCAMAEVEKTGEVWNSNVVSF